MITIERLRRICVAMAEGGDEEVAPTILALIGVRDIVSSSLFSTADHKDFRKLREALAVLEET